MRACSTITLMLVLGTAIAGIPGLDANVAVGLDLGASEHTFAALSPSRDVVAPDPKGAIVPPGNPLWAVPLRELSVTRDRPIFAPSRRPPPPPAVFAEPAPPNPVAAPPLPDRPPLVLIGTIIGHSLQIGIFFDEATKKVVRLTIGENHGGWILRTVGTGEARFESEYRTATLALGPPAQLAVTGNPALATAAEPVIPARHRKR